MGGFVDRNRGQPPAEKDPLQMSGSVTELEHAFKFNDAVLRHLTVLMSEAATGPSPMMKEEKSRSVSAPGEEVKEGDKPVAALAEAAPAPAPAAAA